MIMFKKAGLFMLLLLVCILSSACSTPGTLKLYCHNRPYYLPRTTNKGLMFIYREPTSLAKNRGIYINAGSARIGGVNNGTYFVYEADPGRVELSVENKFKKSPAYAVNIESGKYYFFRVGFSDGLWDYEPFIMRVQDAVGKIVIPSLIYATLE
ncbi:MAG: DUF2846 domain-containing protein [Candidatus Omnitrophota bacterium]